MSNLKEIINKSKSVVFFGGAGVSTESGIPDFRSKDGLYNQQYKYPPEEILSHTFFLIIQQQLYHYLWFVKIVQLLLPLVLNLFVFYHK